MFNRIKYKPYFLIFLFILISKIHTQWFDGALYPDFKINDDSTTTIQQTSRIGVDVQGNFNVVWNDSRYNFLYPRVFCRRFNSVTNPFGSSFQIGQDSAGGPEINVLKDGRFIVTWFTSVPQNTKAYIYYQRFSSTGQPIGNYLKVNDTTFYTVGNKSISSDSLGNFVIVWESYLTSLSVDIYGQRFDSSGNKLGQNFKVNTITNPNSANPSVALNRNGSFIISWDAYPYVKMRQYNINGVPLDVEQRVDDDITNANKGYSSVLDDGNGYFVICWGDTRYYSPPYGNIMFQLYDTSGNKIGTNKIADDNTYNIKQWPRGSMRSDGKFIVIWNDYRNGKYIPYAQRLDKDGTRIGNIFIIPVYTNFTNSRIESCYLFDDRIYSTWSDNRNGGQNYDVFCNIRSFQNPDSILSIKRIGSSGIKEFKLCKPYPNPFNSETIISYELPVKNYIKIYLYDVLGRLVKVIINENQSAGKYSVKLDGTDLASGIYFVKFNTQSGFNEIKKIILLK